MFKKIIKQKKAFTLIELVVTTAIFSFVIMAITYLLSGSLKQNDIFWDQLESQSDGRRVLREIVNIVRTAEDSSLGSYSIVSASDYDLIFYANIDDDSLKEKIHFWLDDTTIKKGVIKPSNDPVSYNTEEQIIEVAHYVVNIEEVSPLFLYYDEDFTGSSFSISS